MNDLIKEMFSKFEDSDADIEMIDVYLKNISNNKKHNLTGIVSLIRIKQLLTDLKIYLTILSNCDFKD